MGSIAPAVDDGEGRVSLAARLEEIGRVTLLIAADQNPAGPRSPRHRRPGVERQPYTLIRFGSSRGPHVELLSVGAVVDDDVHPVPLGTYDGGQRLRTFVRADNFCGGGEAGIAPRGRNARPGLRKIGYRIGAERDGGREGHGGRCQDEGEPPPRPSQRAVRDRLRRADVGGSLLEEEAKPVLRHP